MNYTPWLSTTPMTHPMSLANATFDDTPAKIVGDYFVRKYRSRAANFGVQPVARQLRKQGVAVEIAVLMLAARP